MNRMACPRCNNPISELPGLCWSCAQAEYACEQRFREIEVALGALLQESITNHQKLLSGDASWWKEIASSLIEAKVAVLSARERRKHAVWPKPAPVSMQMIPEEEKKP